MSKKKKNKKAAKEMIIDCISDIRGNFLDLEGGDLLIVIGGLTANDAEIESWGQLELWLNSLNYKKIVVVPGNTDRSSEMTPEIATTLELNEKVKFLCDSGIEYEGLKIWGTPWSVRTEGLDPKYTAYTDSEENIFEKFKLIPLDTDILITYTPIAGILDLNEKEEHEGSHALLQIITRIRPGMHVFGKAHHSHGYLEGSFKTENEELISNIRYVNCSRLGDNGEPLHGTVRVTLTSKDV